MSQITHSIILLSISFLLYWFFIPKKYRHILLFAASFYFMSLFSVGYAVYFVFNAALVYIAGSFIKKEYRNSKLLLKLSLIWLVGSLCVFKYTHLFMNSLFKLGSQLSLFQETTFSRIILPLGLSYIIFRLIHYIVEVYRKNIPEHSFWDLGLYVFFFPTFIAGPVERFQRFHHQTDEIKSLNPSDLNYGLLRIIAGMIKKFVIADQLTPVLMPLLSSPHEYSWILVVLSVYGLAIQIYMDFSGYTDMALGVARLFGYKIMENFNYPYFKKNIALFWRNWHISVYSFIRDYFFLPLFGYRASQLKIYIGIFMTMIVFMLWHVGNMAFLILGIYHGSGLVIWQLFQEIKRKHKRLRKLVDSPYLDSLSIYITFTFVSFGFIIFSFDIGTIKSIISRIF